MRKSITAVILSFFLLPSVSANAFTLSDLFGSQSTVSNIIEGIFTKSNLEVKDLQGSWTVNGSAVAFQGDNFLEKAGGLAAAAAIEAKVDPYFKQYGLTGAVMNINEDGSATLKFSHGSLTGTFEKVDNKDYNFIFKVKVVGITVGDLPAYIEKSYSSLNVMFDAKKLKSLISIVAKVSGNKLATTLGQLLDKYEGMCIGFKMTNSSSSSTAKSSSSQSNDSTAGSTKKTISDGINKLKDIFKK